MSSHSCACNPISVPQNCTCNLTKAVLAAAALNEDGKKRKVIVTGCLAQRYSDQLAADLPEADLVVGFQSYGDLSSSLRGALGVAGADANEYMQRARVQVRAERSGWLMRGSGG
eukprot:361255-Chlamydomonas_euryale.AAC.8